MLPIPHCQTCCTSRLWKNGLGLLLEFSLDHILHSTDFAKLFLRLTTTEIAAIYFFKLVFLNHFG